VTTWYSIRTYSDKCEPVEVVSSTSCFVVVRLPTGKTIREAKNTEWCAICETKRECYEWLASRRIAKIDSIQEQLEDARQQLCDAYDAAKRDGVEL
jgi:hypothetical protein